MRLFSSRVVPDGATVLLTFLLPLFSLSNSSPTGLGLRDDTNGGNTELFCSWDRPQSKLASLTVAYRNTT